MSLSNHIPDRCNAYRLVHVAQEHWTHARKMRNAAVWCFCLVWLVYLWCKWARRYTDPYTDIDTYILICICSRTETWSTQTTAEWRAAPTWRQMHNYDTSTMTTTTTTADDSWLLCSRRYFCAFDKRDASACASSANWIKSNEFTRHASLARIKPHKSIWLMCCANGGLGLEAWFETQTSWFWLLWVINELLRWLSNNFRFSTSFELGNQLVQIAPFVYLEICLKIRCNP